MSGVTRATGITINKATLAVLSLILAIVVLGGTVSCSGDYEIESVTLVPDSQPSQTTTEYQPTQTPPDSQQTQISPAAHYYELPKFSYVGITPPPGKAHELYDLLVRMRHRSNWSSLYTQNEFDCSEMSGFLESHLELCGFDTYILVAELTGRDWASALGIGLNRLIGLRSGNKAYHAWIAVKIDNEYLAVEATTPCIDNYYGAYKYQSIYSSVEEAENAMPGQFDFLNSSQFQNLQSD